MFAQAMLVELLNKILQITWKENLQYHLPDRTEDGREMSQNIRSAGSDLNIWHSEYDVDVLTT
jgi:hypothetical protein